VLTAGQISHTCLVSADRPRDRNQAHLHELRTRLLAELGVDREGKI
jgi:hypothetical protein